MSGRYYRVGLGSMLVVVLTMAGQASALSVIAGPRYNAATDKNYYLLEPSSWTEAEATAVTMGGHLTSLGDAAEQEWVRSVFGAMDTGAPGCFSLSGNRPDGLWTGLNDVTEEGIFVWADGTAFSYTNWAAGEPFDSGNEDYVAINNNTATGVWMDVPDTVGTCRVCGVVEVPATRVITTNDDTHVQRVQEAGQPYGPDYVWNSKRVVSTFTNPAGGGTYANKIPFMEFTLGTEAATTATLNVYCELSYGGISGYIYAKEMDFNDTTATYNNTIGSGSIPTGSEGGYFSEANGWVDISDVKLALGETDNNVPSTLKNLGGTGTGWKSFSVLDWYNANLGKTMTVVFLPIGPLQGQDVRWSSKENDTPNRGPRLIVGTEIIECTWEVSPTPTHTAYVLASLTPRTYEVTVKTLTGAGVSYTVQEVAADGVTPHDHPWLTLDKTSGGPIEAGNTDTVQFTVNSPNQTNTGYLRFIPQCGSSTGGADPQVRTIQVINSLVNGQPYVNEYLGDKDPLLLGACGTDCQFELVLTEPGCQAMGASVHDPAANDGKAWRILDDNTPDTWTHYRVSNSAPGVTSHNGYLGSTLLARIKVPSNTAAGTMLGINQKDTPYNGVRLEWGGAGPSLPGLAHETYRGASGVDNGSTSSEYTVIRIASGFGVTGSRSIRVWVNEDKEPVPVPLEVLSLSNLLNGPGVRGYGYGFGMEGIAEVTGEVWVDWVSFTTAGMFAPGEEESVLGRSLIPVGLPDPFADTDRDGDVDQVDFARFQLCYGASVSENEDCGYFDRDGDETVGILDYGAFEACASGSGVPADPTCDDPD